MAKLHILFLSVLLLHLKSIEMKIKDELMHISVVACGDRLEESQMMIRSAVLFSKAPIHVHIFADDDLMPLFKSQLNTWPSFIKEKFNFSVYPITYPEKTNGVEWRNVFKPCATQRLFIPYVLPMHYSGEVKRLLYVDTDILFFLPVDSIWEHFDHFNDTQIAALSPEHEAKWMGWYNRFARHPYYGEMGVNSGVMLMDLEKLRESDWQQKMVDYYKEYKLKITWGDQDLINIFFSFYPEKLYVFDCSWNYRADHCMYGSECPAAERDGVRVVHGSRGYYHNDKQPAFKAIYQTLKKYKFGDDLEEKFLKPLKLALEDTKHSQCEMLLMCVL